MAVRIYAFILLVLPFRLLSAEGDGGDNYEYYLNLGLKSEGLQQWPDAISNYVKALEKQPESSLPRERIISIFKQLKSEKKSRAELLLLLPPDLQDKLSKSGIFQSAADEEAFLRRLNFFFWLFAAVALILLAGGFSYLVRKKKNDEAAEAEGRYSRGSKSRKAGTQAKTDSAAPGLQKKEVAVTQKTREEMTHMIEGIKSIHSVETPSAVFNEGQRETLEQSEVLEALAQTLLSEVSSEENSQGKFSKLSLDASLIFDEKDIPPDIQEWRAQHGDEGLENYLEKRSDDEAKEKKK